MFTTWYWKVIGNSDAHLDAFFNLISSINAILNCPDKNVGPSHFMRRDLWPKKNASQPQLHQCRLDLNLTWKYTIIPYIENAISFDGQVDAKTKVKLKKHWEEFLDTLLPIPPSQD